MKKIVLFIGILGLSLNSCTSYIEEDNRSLGNPDEFYLTAPGFEALVNTNYFMLKDIYGGEPWLFAAGTDMYSEGRNMEPDGLSKYANLDATSAGVEHLYKTCYAAIQQANTGLHFAPLTAPSTNLNARVGELKFLRAHAYF